MASNSIHSHANTMLAARISQNIKRLRLEKGWSRPQLGARLTPPTSGQQIEKLETGVRRLTVDWLDKVARALGVDPAALIAGDTEQFDLSPQVASEVAAQFARVVLQGAEPDPAIVQDLAVILLELSETFSRHPYMRRDPGAVRPVVDVLTRPRARQ